MSRKNPTQDAALDRRSFLKLGLAGSAMLGTAGLAASLGGCSGVQQSPAHGYYFLRTGDVALFSALIPVVHAGAPLTPAIVAEALKRVDGAFLYLQPPAQREVRKLLDLLDAPLLRRLATGVRTPWAQASPAEVDAFLKRWRDSRVALFNAGYSALVKFCSVAYYAQTASQAVSGYPGPLPMMYQAVNATGAGA